MSNKFHTYDILKSLIITEKEMCFRDISDNLNKFSFYVHPWVNKKIIKSIFHKNFGVKVLTVNTANKRSSQKRFRGVVGSSSRKKKAIVTFLKSSNFDYNTFCEANSI